MNIQTICGGVFSSIMVRNFNFEPIHSLPACLFVEWGCGGGKMKHLQLSAVVRRLPQDHAHSSYWEDKNNRAAAGYVGEHQVIRLLGEREEESRWISGFSYSQHEIDILLVTKHCLFCIEVKNISGRLDIEQGKSQLLRTRIDGIQDSFNNPAEQVKRHVRLVKKLAGGIPVIGLVVIANPQTIIGTAPSDVPILHMSGLSSIITSLMADYHSHHLDVELVYQYFLELHKPALRKLPFSESDFLNGVLCPACFFKVPMFFQHGTFICPACKLRDKHAYEYALADYRLLIGEMITNQAFRRFCKVASRDAANRLLRNFERIGDTRGAVYKIPEQIITKHQDLLFNSRNRGRFSRN